MPVEGGRRGAVPAAGAATRDPLSRGTTSRRGGGRPARLPARCGQVVRQCGLGRGRRPPGGRHHGLQVRTADGPLDGAAGLSVTWYCWPGRHRRPARRDDRRAAADPPEVTPSSTRPCWLHEKLLAPGRGWAFATAPCTTPGDRRC
ncbi:hypothetical protein HBB16_12705 [Pseudonocardia sp. MCCB 268]|nr:hypothetical protein [Pseudonocardia cytotoxica]